MSGRPDDDRELVTQAQAGSVEAYGLLYEQYAPAIHRYLYAHLSDRLDAEDLTGEVFLKAWQSIASFRPRGVPFVAYLFRVAHNTLIDHYRRSAKKAERPISQVEETMPDSHPGPAELTGARLEHQELQKFMTRLNQDYQTVLILRFISELSPDETAMVMGRSAGSVRVLQHRALTALRKEMGDHQVG